MADAFQVNEKTSRPALIGIVLTTLLLLLLARYAAAPVTGFSADDWAFLNRAVQCETYADAWKLMLKDPDRPLQAGVITAIFKTLGDRPWAYSLLSAATNALFVVVAVAFVGSLTGSRRTTLCFGILIVLFPNLIESFNWPAMTTVGYNQAAYVGSALCWVLYLKRGGLSWLILSALCYGAGITTYEWGFGLPAALAVLLLPREYRRRSWGLIAFAVVVAVYLTWRFTQGFGTAPGVLFVPRTPEVSAGLMLWNAREVVSWWLGGHMMTCIRNGLDAYATMGKWAQRIFFFADIGAVAALSVLLLRGDKTADSATRSPTGFSSWLVAAFGLVWFAAGHAPSLFSWVASRMIFFPAVGLALFLAVFLATIDIRRWLPWFSAAAFVFLLSDQGTNYSWKESGKSQRGLYEHVCRHQQDWSGAEVILFDTASIRHRQTPGILAPAETDPRSWAYYGNACFLRGFVPWAMVRLAKPDGPWPVTALDMEHGARIENGELIWHERYDPDKPLKTPMEKVYVVDCFAAGSGQEN